jgi:hypothetical protein
LLRQVARDELPDDSLVLTGAILIYRSLADVTGNIEIRNLVQPQGTRRIVAGVPVTGLSGNAWASVGCQSKACAGAVNTKGASGTLRT